MKYGSVSCLEWHVIINRIKWTDTLVNNAMFPKKNLHTTVHNCKPPQPISPLLNVSSILVGLMIERKFHGRARTGQTYTFYAICSSNFPICARDVIFYTASWSLIHIEVTLKLLCKTWAKQSKVILRNMH